MTAQLTISDLVTRPGDDEPRVSDQRLAEVLGFLQPRAIRTLISRRMDELKGYGPVDVVQSDAKIEKGRGRPEVSYLLNEAQATLVCMFARTDRAAEVRREIIAVYSAWRNGRLRDVSQAEQARATPMITPDYRARNRVRYAKMRLVEIVMALDELGVDVAQIDMAVVRDFGRKLRFMPARRA